MIHLGCPSCKQPLSIPDEFAGKSGRCNYCAAPVEVPAVGGVPRVDNALAGPYSAPRIPARPGVGMIASEAEHAGGAGASLGRIAVFGVLAVVIVACILPALVIGYTAENKAPEETRPRSLPVARGAAADSATDAAASPLPSVVPSSAIENVDSSRLVFATLTDTHFHRAGCPHLGSDAQTLAYDVARARGLKPCASCAK